MLVKVLVSLVCCSLLVGEGEGAAAGVDLKALYEAHSWFELREAIAAGDAPALYKGAVAAAFNKTAEAEEIFRSILATAPDSDDAVSAAEWLSYMYLRAGRYQESASGTEDESGWTPMLRSLPDQSVDRFEPSRLHSRRYSHRIMIPVNVAGKASELFLDSDANFSFLSESEARRLGLAVRETGIEVHGVTGERAGVRIAMADTLAIGGIQLRHVAFLVMDDKEPIFSNLAVDQQGALGIPVLLALRTLKLSRDVLEVGFPATNGEKSSEMCFDGADLVALVQFEQQRLPVVFDTGAVRTELWPPFAKKFPNAVGGLSKTGWISEAGFGGTSRLKGTVFPELRLSVGGRMASLRAARILADPTTPNSRWYYGRLGADVLEAASQVSIDFESLTLTLE